jgi:hypothetical protein
VRGDLLEEFEVAKDEVGLGDESKLEAAVEREFFQDRASFRFCACERESCTVTLIPLGRCRSVTAVATLFTC